MHPRNRHQGGLEFKRLAQTSPGLAPFVALNEWGNESIDFANPAAMKALNKALLKQFYGVALWDLPPGYLCPSVPGRADYLHSLADLLASSNQGVIPRGAQVRALDIGVGANCVYPLIGTSEYGWRFLGSEIDPVALASAAQIVKSNPGLKGKIELRLQTSPERMLEGLLIPGESFEVSLCNPPFHSSPEAAEEGARRKWKNLGKAAHGPKASKGKPASKEKPASKGKPGSKEKPALNFGGQGAELWCPGGESQFVRRLIEESAQDRARCFWFTTLVSKQSNLPSIQGALKKARASESRVFELTQGQKTSRIVAWTFLDERQQAAWRERRW